MKLNKDINNVVSTFERHGLNVMQISRYGEGDPTSAILGLVDFNGETFALDIRGTVAYMSFAPVYPKRNFVPYPEDLPTPTKIDIYYKPSDLTPNLRNALIEVGGRKIFSKEVEGFDITYFGITSPESLPQQQNNLNPFIGREYRLQKPSDEYSKCIAAIDIKDFDSRLFPYHTQQVNHYCMTGIEEFSLIPLDVNEHNTGLVLDVKLLWDMDKERIKEIFVGLPLPFNTSVLFTNHDAKWNDTIPPFQSYGFEIEEPNGFESEHASIL